MHKMAFAVTSAAASGRHVARRMRCAAMGRSAVRKPVLRENSFLLLRAPILRKANFRALCEGAPKRKAEDRGAHRCSSCWHRHQSAMEMQESQG